MWQLELMYLIYFSSPCPRVNTMILLLFQNGLVTSSPEMFKLKSCIRRKTDSIDKRFCFDIEVVERFELFFSLYFFHKLNCVFLYLNINMKQHSSVFQSFKKQYTCLFHSFMLLLHNAFEKANPIQDAGKQQHHSKQNQKNQYK